jgi:chitodextrinase
VEQAECGHDDGYYIDCGHGYVHDGNDPNYCNHEAGYEDNCDTYDDFSCGYNDEHVETEVENDIDTSDESSGEENRETEEEQSYSEDCEYTCDDNHAIEPIEPTIPDIVFEDLTLIITPAPGASGGVSIDNGFGLGTMPFVMMAMGTPCAHNGGFNGRTCTNGGQCFNCGQHGAPLGHNITGRNCINGGKCSRCGVSGGNPLGHIASPTQFFATHPHQGYYYCVRHGCAERLSTGTFGYFSTCTVCNPPPNPLNTVPTAITIEIGFGAARSIYNESPSNTATASIVSGASFIKLTQGVLSWSVEGIAPGTATVRVTRNGASRECNVTVTSSASVPAAPTNLTTSNITANSIQLTWTASAGATGYDIFRNNSLVGNTTGTAFTSTGLSPRTTYSFFVRAKNSTGTSGNSNTVTAATLAAPTGVTISNKSNNTINVNDSRTLSATATPNNADQRVTWSTSDSSIADIHPNTGLMCGRKADTARIRATSVADPTIFDEFWVTVVDNTDNGEIVLDPKNPYEVGQSFNAEYFFPIKVSNPHSYEVTFTFSDGTTVTGNHNNPGEFNFSTRVTKDGNRLVARYRKPEFSSVGTHTLNVTATWRNTNGGQLRTARAHLEIRVVPRVTVRNIDAEVTINQNSLHGLPITGNPLRLEVDILHNGVSLGNVSAVASLSINDPLVNLIHVSTTQVTSTHQRRRYDIVPVMTGNTKVSFSFSFTGNLLNNSDYVFDLQVHYPNIDQNTIWELEFVGAAGNYLATTTSNTMNNNLFPINGSAFTGNGRGNRLWHPVDVGFGQYRLVSLGVVDHTSFGEKSKAISYTHAGFSVDTETDGSRHNWRIKRAGQNYQFVHEPNRSIHLSREITNVTRDAFRIRNFTPSDNLLYGGGFASNVQKVDGKYKVTIIVERSAYNSGTGGAAHFPRSMYEAAKRFNYETSPFQIDVFFEGIHTIAQINTARQGAYVVTVYGATDLPIANAVGMVFPLDINGNEITAYHADWYGANIGLRTSSTFHTPSVSNHAKEFIFLHELAHTFKLYHTYADTRFTGDWEFIDIVSLMGFQSGTALYRLPSYPSVFDKILLRRKW